MFLELFEEACRYAIFAIFASEAGEWLTKSGPCVNCVIAFLAFPCHAIPRPRTAELVVKIAISVSEATALGAPDHVLTSVFSSSFQFSKFAGCSLLDLIVIRMLGNQSKYAISLVERLCKSTQRSRDSGRH